MWAATDEALLAGMAGGDADAAKAFVQRFQRQVFGLAVVVLGGDANGAEDVAQEAFVRAWRYAANYDARRGSVVTWLLTITRNLAIDALRMRRVDPVSPDVMNAMNLVSAEKRPDEHAAASDEAARLRAAIAELPVEQRRALVLAAFHGRSAREVGEAEQIPLGTAKTRIRSAMLRLRAELSKDEEV
jgi:RNA polymerase sigma-70 factor (ECF subfamily)